MKGEVIKVVMKLALNDGAKTTRQVLSESEFKMVPKLVEEGMICTAKNPNYHYVDERNKISRALQSTYDLLSDIL